MFLFVMLILALILYEYSKPKPINWTPSYTGKHKIPLGAYIVKNELGTLFPNSEIQEVSEPPFTFLEDDSRKGTYIFINDKIGFDDAEFKRILRFAEDGNDVFISSHGFIIDTLNIETKPLVTGNVEERLMYKVYNKRFSQKEYSIDIAVNNQVFTSLDTLNATVLGMTAYLNEQGNRTEQGVNFIKQQHGQGNVYFHTFPELFSNYGLLHASNNRLASEVLSYLNDNGTIYWDAYYKSGKASIGSPMHFILNDPGLKWAYYVALIGVLFFVIFEGRRKQRIIPIITPLKNQTLAFTRTIANMYYERGEHKNIAEHRIAYLMEFVRVKLRIPTHKVDDTFYRFVASRSGNSLKSIKYLFNYCERIHLKNTITKEELLELNSLIEEFKKSINA